MYGRRNQVHLCQEDLDQQETYVVFISNAPKCFPILGQRSASSPSSELFWDYHVVAVTKDKSNNLMLWDLDTILPFPHNLCDYILSAFRSVFQFPEKYHPMFKVFTKEEFISSFYSDRSHMLKQDSSGEYLAPPPSWDLCKPKTFPEKYRDLKEFMDFSGNSKDKIFTLSSFMDAFK